MTINDNEKDSQAIDHHDDYQDKDLSALYQSLSKEQPSSSADDTILKLAQQATMTRSQKTWLNKWSRPVSVAAVVVLSVSIVTVLQQESARSPERLSEAVSPSDIQTLQEINKNGTDKIFDLNVRNEKHDTTPTTISSATLTVTEGENDTENEISAAPSAERSLSPVAPSPPSRSVRKFAKKNTSKQLENKSALAITPAADTAISEVQRSRKASGKPAQAQSQRKTISSDLSKPIQPQAKQLRQPLRQRLQKAPLSTSKMRTLSQAVTEPLVTLKNRTMSADSGSAVQKKESPRSELTLVPKQKPKSMANLCAKNSHSRCLESSLCILIKDASANKGLRCIEAKSYCEKQFVQKDAEPGQCHLKKNCWLRPGVCQCGKDENCTCEKTGPPMCVPTN